MSPTRHKNHEPSKSPTRPRHVASPKERMLAVGKALFAENGFEATSTSSIARKAKTSESQLMRYFGGKSGLLEEIFNTSWAGLNQSIGAQVVAAPTGRDAILVILETIVDAFHEDEELGIIFLFEGRRIRGADHEVFISQGFLSFRELICNLIRRGRADGSIVKPVQEAALVSALIGCAEGMIRDRLVAKRVGKIDDFPREEITKIFTAILENL